MDTKRKAIIITSLFALLSLLIFSQYFLTHYRNSSTNSPNKAQSTFQTNGEIPGNPANGVRSLQEFFKIREKYIAMTGNSAADVNTILNYIYDNAGKFGITSTEQLSNLLSNPDNKYSDNDNIRKSPGTIYLRIPNNFNCKENNTRRIICSSDTYLHRNIKQTGEEKSTINPVGFYQILWSDGTVEEIPYHKILYAPDSNRRYKEAFPGQCGLPEGTLSYDEYWTKIGHFTTAPRGVKGKQGVDFSGKRY